MSPKRPRVARRWLLIGGAGLVIAVAAVGAFLVSSRQRDVYNPGVRFRTEPPPAPPQPPPARPDTDPFTWAVYGYTKDRRGDFPASTLLRPPYARLLAHTRGGALGVPPAPAPPAPPVRAALVAPRGRAAGVPPRPGRAVAVPPRQQGCAACDRPAPRPRAVDAEARDARRVLARLFRRAGVRDPAEGPGRRRARRGAQRAERRDPVVALAAEPLGVLPARRPRAAVLRLGGRHRVRAAGLGRRGAVDVPRERRGQGRSRAVRRTAVLRRLCGP